jgi:iron(III) transport system permease protein
MPPGSSAADRCRLAVALACAGYALPGVVIGVGLLVWVGMIDRWLGMMLLGGTVAAVIYAYGVRFFSIAYQGLEAALVRISPTMDQSARSLGADAARGAGATCIGRCCAPAWPPPRCWWWWIA